MGENRAGYAFKSKLKESFIVFLWNFEVMFFKKCLPYLTIVFLWFFSCLHHLHLLITVFRSLIIIGNNQTLAINCELSLAATRLLSS